MPDLYSLQLFFPAEKITCVYKKLSKFISTPKNSSKHSGTHQMLLIPLDETVQDWLELHSYSIKEFIVNIGATKFVRAGYFDIRKTTSGKYGSLTITSQTSHTNYLIKNCSALHQQILDVLGKCRGLFVLIDIGEAEMAVVGKPDTFLLTDPDNHDTEEIDYTIECAKEQFEWLNLD